MENDLWDLSFISESNFNKCLLETISTYSKSIQSYTLKKFNNNIIDSIKLIFDLKVNNLSLEDMVYKEVIRQIDKSNNNAIGYFHQNLFKYIKYCEVPTSGFDVIFNKDNCTIYVELKNKHNTTNSDSGKSIYRRFLKKITECPSSYCFLVGVISKESKNEIWKIKDYNVSTHIRKVSIDLFYEQVTGDPFAFYKICMKLPSQLDKVLSNLSQNNYFSIKEISMLLSKEIFSKNNNPFLSLYNLSFPTYKGFFNNNKKKENK